MHAGIIYRTDSACGYAAFFPHARRRRVLHGRVQDRFPAPAAADRFTLVGSVVKSGRTLSVCQGEAIGERAQKRILIATMTSTVMAVQGRSDVQQ